MVISEIACVASISIRFRSKERPRIGIFGFDWREIKRMPLPALLLAPFVARPLTPVPRSLLLNRTETLATQAISETEGNSASLLNAYFEGVTSNT